MDKIYVIEYCYMDIHDSIVAFKSQEMANEFCKALNTIPNVEFCYKELIVIDSEQKITNQLRQKRFSQGFVSKKSKS